MVRDGLRAVVSRRPVASFFVLAYLLAWSCWLPLILTGSTVRDGVGWPTHAPGLLAPLVAAVVVTALGDGRPGVVALARRATRWQVPARWYIAVAAPLVLYAGCLLARGVVTGDWPSSADLAAYSGLPSVGVLVPVLALVVNGFGEEVGWRGFALPQLQRDRDPLRATVLLTAGWAGWHVPLFVVLAGYRGFSALTAVGFGIGLVTGAVVLTWVCNGSGGSVLVAALWHTSYNLTTATRAGAGLPAAVVSAAVIVAGVLLARQHVAAVRQGNVSPLAPPGVSVLPPLPTRSSTCST